MNQDEIDTMLRSVETDLWFSYISKSKVNHSTDLLSIRDTDQYVKRAGDYEVVFEKTNTTIQCSCTKFETTGKMFRHCFYVLRMSSVNRFPAKYVENQWRKDVVPRKSYVCKEFEGKKQEDDIKTMVRDLHLVVDQCVDCLSSNLEKLRLYRDKQMNLKKNVDHDTVGEEPMTNKEFIESVIGVGKRTDIQVRVPTGVRNKGSKKRLISEKEKAIISAKKRVTEMWRMWGCTDDNRTRIIE
ncbi:hypothetical protein LXL04_016460 [Taraxacum kok-saghyz]